MLYIKNIQTIKNITNYKNIYIKCNIYIYIICDYKLITILYIIYIKCYI